MNKIDLELKIEGLEKAITEHKDFTGTYEGQLKETQKQLADYNKPELTPAQFDDIYEAIEEAVNQYDFSDTDNFEIEYGIDYDGRITCESHEMNDTGKLVEMIIKSVSKLFAEATEDEPINERLEQPIETQPVVEEIPQAEECESEVTTTKPSETDMADLNKRAQEKKEEKEKSFKKRTWF